MATCSLSKFADLLQVRLSSRCENNNFVSRKLEVKSQLNCQNEIPSDPNKILKNDEKNTKQNEYPMKISLSTIHKNENEFPLKISFSKGNKSVNKHSSKMSLSKINKFPSKMLLSKIHQNFFTESSWQRFKYTAHDFEDFLNLQTAKGLPKNASTYSVNSKKLFGKNQNSIIILKRHLSTSRIPSRNQKYLSSSLIRRYGSCDDDRSSCGRCDPTKIQDTKQNSCESKGKKDPCSREEENPCEVKSPCAPPPKDICIMEKKDTRKNVCAEKDPCKKDPCSDRSSARGSCGSQICLSPTDDPCCFRPCPPNICGSSPRKPPESCAFYADYIRKARFARLWAIVSLPLLVLLGMYAYNVREDELNKPRPPFVDYPYMYRLGRPYWFGDGKHSFFHNPARNPIPPHGYEAEDPYVVKRRKQKRS